MHAHAANRRATSPVVTWRPSLFDGLFDLGGRIFNHLIFVAKRNAMLFRLNWLDQYRFKRRSIV